MKPNARDEIRNRGNGGNVSSDTTVAALEEEAKKIEAQINGGALPQAEPSPEELELQAQALKSRAEQIRTANPALLPDQIKVIQDLRTHYLKLLNLGFALPEANALIQHYSGIAGFEAALLRKVVKK